MPAFEDMGLALNIGLFAAAAVVVWLAGTRISFYVDDISEQTGLGQALLGLILLAGATSLPEIAVTVTAAATGNADLAVNNLFGSIAMQVAVLAAIDFMIGRRALTAVVPNPAVIVQGALNVILLSIAACGIVVGDAAFLGIGLWSWACLFGYIAGVWLLSQSEDRRPWLPTGRLRKDSEKEAKRKTKKRTGSSTHRSLRATIGLTMAAGLCILVAGYIVSRTGEAMAEQTGLGSNFFGFVLVAISTSLPEFSAALSAARLGLFTMAISGILGTNLINVGLLFLVDAVSAGEPVLNQVGKFATVGALIGIVVSALFVTGIAERRDRTIWRMGIDSIAVLIVYAGGLVILFYIR